MVIKAQDFQKGQLKNEKEGGKSWEGERKGGRERERKSKNKYESELGT